MFDGNEWHQLHREFLIDSEILISRANECVQHLELIGNDPDAIDCLLSLLQQVAEKARQVGVELVSAFAGQLRAVLHRICASGPLSLELIACLKQCVALLAWQVELIEPDTGLLPLDEAEQRSLLDRLGCTHAPAHEPACALSLGGAGVPSPAAPARTA